MFRIDFSAESTDGSYRSAPDTLFSIGDMEAFAASWEDEFDALIGLYSQLDLDDAREDEEDLLSCGLEVPSALWISFQERARELRQAGLSRHPRVRRRHVRRDSLASPAAAPQVSKPPAKPALLDLGAVDKVIVDARQLAEDLGNEIRREVLDSLSAVTASLEEFIFSNAEEERQDDPLGIKELSKRGVLRDCSSPPPATARLSAWLAWLG